jgi:hypothetical protein
VELEEKEAEYIQQLNEKEIDEDKFRELVESREGELEVVDKVIESSTISKGKQKAVPTRAKVYMAVDEPVSDLVKSSSIYANTFAYSVTDASRGR